MDTFKIYYTKDGWLCERANQDIPKSDAIGFIEVDEETYWKTMCEPDDYHSWRYVNGELLLEQFKEIPALTLDEGLSILRTRRKNECFIIINRGVLWYNTLTEEQRLELDKWYKEWLDITDTYRNAYEENPEFDIETIIPIKPTWLK